MPGIDTILFAIIAIDALIVLALGAGAALVIVLDVQKEWPTRVPRAAFSFVLSSLGCGALLWVAGYMFGQAARGIDAILFYIVVFDALVVLVAGLAAAVVILLNLKTSDFVERLPFAAIVLVLSSLGCGALLWGGRYVIGG